MDFSSHPLGCEESETFCAPTDFAEGHEEGGNNYGMRIKQSASYEPVWKIAGSINIAQISQPFLHVRIVIERRGGRFAPVF